MIIYFLYCVCFSYLMHYSFSYTLSNRVADSITLFFLADLSVIVAIIVFKLLYMLIHFICTISTLLYLAVRLVIIR